MPARRTASRARPSSPPKERAHRRRAEKAAYLRDKLAEAEKADRAAGAEPARPS